MNRPEFLTTAQAAARLRIDPSLVRRYCRQGRLGVKIGKQWLIAGDDLKRFEAIPRRVGRPKEEAS